MIKQWISTKDRLPEESGEVVVKVEDVGNSTVAFYSIGRKQFIVTDKRPEFWLEHGTGGATAYKDDAVTHWMPLPSFNQSDVEIRDPYVHDLEQEIELLECVIKKYQQKSKFMIKPLEWTEENGGFNAYGSFGIYQIMETGDKILPWTGSLNDANGYDGYEPMDFATVEQAAAHCQALHEKQIMAALEFVEVQE